MATKLTEIESPETKETDLQEARVRNRAGRTIARVIGAFDWDEALHLRHEKGSDFGGRFRKGPSKRGTLRQRIVPRLSSAQIGKALDRPRPGGVSGELKTPASPEVGHGDLGRLRRGPKGRDIDLLGMALAGMASPPGGWTSTDESDHPVYDKDFPGKAGKAIRVGDLFTMDGKEWEVAHVVKGHLIIDEASGKKSKVETRIIHPTEAAGAGNSIGGLTPTSTKKITGGKKNSTVRIVDPYNDPQTHDSALEVPKNSHLKADEWLQFGRAEQLHYIDLMERYGEWKSGAPIQSMVNAILNEFDQDIVQAVKSAHNQQYSSSTGGTLSLVDLSGSKAALEKRSKAMDLQGRLRDVIAWDLYNRTKSPDLMVFHGSNSGVSWWKSLITKSQVFSGMSQSFNIKPTHKFGANKVATPLSIRHICFATTVVDWVGSPFASEHEITMVPQFKADLKRSMVFEWGSIGPAAKKWLTNITKHPKSGATLKLLREHLEKGEPLPVTVDPEIHFAPSDKKPPNPAALEALEEYGQELPDIKDQSAAELGQKKLPWAETDAQGNPVLKSGEDASVKPGDFLVGQKGTLYWLDGDMTIHMIVADSAGNLSFNGETYTWNGQHKNYFLKGNVPPLKDENAPDFDEGAWQYAAVDKQAISKMDVGTKFKVDGVTYEKLAQGDINTTPIKDLETGKTGTVNSGYQTVPLVPAAGHHASTTLKPEKGMTLSYEGKKAVVTSVKKDGTVAIKPKGSTVVTLAPDDPALDDLFQPEDWSIGAKTQIGNLAAGDYFHGGTGSMTIKPYKVLDASGSKILWQNMDTGEKGQSLKHKQVRKLDPATGSPGDAEHEPPKPPADEVEKAKEAIASTTSPDPESAIGQATEITASDVDGLPKADHFAPYASAWGSGGKYKHDKISEMPVGTVFQDKNKQLWKKQAEDVITDGEQNFTVDGSLRGRKVDKLMNGAPDPPQVPNPYAIDKPAEDWPTDVTLQSNSTGKVLSDLPAGALFTMPDGEMTWMVAHDQPDANSVLAYNADGDSVLLVDGLAPAAWSGPSTIQGPKLAAPAETKKLLGKNAKGSPIGELGGDAYYEHLGQLYYLDDEQNRWVVLPDGSTEALALDTTDKLYHSLGVVPGKVWLPSKPAPDGGMEQAPPTSHANAAKDKTPLTDTAPGGTIKVAGKEWTVIAHGDQGTYLMHNVGGPDTEAMSVDKSHATIGKVKEQMGVELMGPGAPIGQPKEGKLLEDAVSGKTFKVHGVGEKVYIQNVDDLGEIHALEKSDTIHQALSSAQDAPDAPDGILGADPPDKTLGDLYEAQDEFEVDGQPFQFVTKLSSGNVIVKNLTSEDLLTLPGDTSPTDTNAFGKKPVPPQPAQDVDKDLLDGVPAELIGKMPPPEQIPELSPAPFDYYGSKWGKGAKYKHWQLSELTPGTHFKPKGQPKGDYILVKSLAGGMVLIYQPEANLWFTAEASGRVRLLSE